MKTSKVLITGASGFVGQHLVGHLVDNGYSVIGLTSSGGKLASTDDVQYCSGDINDTVLRSILAEHRPNAIVHLAAQTTTWFNSPEQMFKTNIFGTINLYEEVIRLKSQYDYNPKILYVSSSEVYGKTTQSELVSEDAPFFPVNHYASSKASADRISYEYAQSNKLNIVIARAFTHTGPGQRLGFFVPDMASQIVDLENHTENYELFVGNLDAVRDYLDVDDVVRAYRLILESEDIPNGTALNVCSGRGIQVKEILRTLLKLAHKDIILRTDPNRMRPSDVPVLIGDNSRLRKQTDWQPRVDLDETLHRVLDYWRAVHNDNNGGAIL